MNIADMMQQAKAMQEKMKNLQDEVAQLRVQGSSGGGMINIIMKCNKEVETIKIDPSVINPNDKEMLEDLIVAAINDAAKNAEEKTADESAKVLSGMGFPPGTDLPF